MNAAELCNRLRIRIASLRPLVCDAEAYRRAYELDVAGFPAAPRDPMLALYAEPILAVGPDRFRLAGRNYSSSEQFTGSRSALVFAAQNPDGRIVDLAAWPFSGREIFLRIGSVPLLGLEHLRDQPTDQPLDVHETPLAFLRADRRGLLILDDGGAGEALSGLTLAAANLPAGHRLRERLSPHARRPIRIVVPEFALA